MAEPIIYIASIEHAADLDRILGAMGRGYGTFTAAGEMVALTGDPNTHTHYTNLDLSADAVLAEECRAMADPERRELPDISPKAWGVNGEISEEDALAALPGLQVITYAGEPLPNYISWRNSVLSGLGLTLWVSPEE